MISLVFIQKLIMLNIKPEAMYSVSMCVQRGFESRGLTALTVLTVDEVFHQCSSNFFKQLHLCSINTKHFLEGILCLQDNIKSEWHLISTDNHNNICILNINNKTFSLVSTLKDMNL